VRMRSNHDATDFLTFTFSELFNKQPPCQNKKREMEMEMDSGIGRLGTSWAGTGGEHSHQSTRLANWISQERNRTQPLPPEYLLVELSAKF
jgi:hypothetical protein